MSEWFGSCSEFTDSKRAVMQEEFNLGCTKVAEEHCQQAANYAAMQVAAAGGKAARALVMAALQAGHEVSVDQVMEGIEEAMRASVQPEVAQDQRQCRYRQSYST
jgi:hypothetical protein